MTRVVPVSNPPIRLENIAAQSVNWPPAVGAFPETHRGWKELHNAVSAIRELVSKTEQRVNAKHRDTNLSDVGRINAITEIGLTAIKDVNELPEIARADSAVEDMLTAQFYKVELPEPPVEVADVLADQEIRAYVADQKDPLQWLIKHKADRQIVRAVLTAKPFLSGLSEESFNIFRATAEAAMNPETGPARKKLRDGQAVMHAAVGQAERAIAEITYLTKDQHGTWVAKQRAVRAA